ncbi:MAG: putative toxin-antitoxin system toxin component, PIN family [Thermoanaerobaculia bacterium]|nr:putative toxin-antitoxin system toxin component, PIN family [Thermoanaerobaculia bacterium]
MKPRPVVVDTNVLVSGLLTSDENSPTARILDAMLSGRLVFLLSEVLIEEYLEVLRRPKIRRRHGLDDESLQTLLIEITLNGLVRQPAPWHDPPPHLSSQPHGDPNDLHLWSLLRTHPDAVLVTGELPLPEVAPVGRVVLTPRQFLGEHRDSLD